MQMRSSAYWLCACLAVMAFPGLPTVAAADDWEICAKQSADVAIAACSRAIASGRYRGRDLANAYYNRGAEYEAKGDLDRAMVDYNEAIRLDPQEKDFYNNRGTAWQAKGNLDRAIADYDEAIRLDPKERTFYNNRGTAHLYSGSLPKAVADFNQASELDPTNAYTALWLDIVNNRRGLPGRLADAAKRIDMSKWPAPVIRLYLGQLTAEAVLAAANDPDASTRTGQVCEANFYTGELALQQGKKDEAKRLFDRAAADCPRSFPEYDGAVAELKVLGARP